MQFIILIKKITFIPHNCTYYLIHININEIKKYNLYKKNIK